MEQQNTQIIEFKSKWQLVLSLALSLALTACGGGGGGESLSGIESQTQLSGQVMDGYIQGATVCLDLNDNGSCDTNEPSTVSGAQGAYVLNHSTAVNLSGLSILANVPVGALDQDGPVYTAYQMRTTAQAPALVTPLTTLAVYDMKTSGATWTQAQQAVSLRLAGDASAINFAQDYVAQANATLHATARSVASSLQTSALNGAAPAAILAAAYASNTQVAFAAAPQVTAPVSATVNDYLRPNNQP